MFLFLLNIFPYFTLYAVVLISLHTLAESVTNKWLGKAIYYHTMCLIFLNPKDKAKHQNAPDHKFTFPQSLPIKMHTDSQTGLNGYSSLSNMGLDRL